MDKNSMIYKNTLELNKLAAKCLRITILFILSLWIFSLSDYYQCDPCISSIICVLCVILLLIPSFVVNVMNYESKWIKYIVILCMISVVFLICNFVSYEFIFMVSLPLLVSALYCDKKLIAFTTIIDIICILITITLRHFLFYDYQNITHSSLLDTLVYNGGNQIQLVLITTLFAYYIVDRNMLMLNNTISANQDLIHNQEELIFAFSEISESKSKVTGYHIHRVANYISILGRASGFTNEFVEKLSVASMMHDIGKLMIAEEILDKPDKLTDEEYAIMKNHVLYGEALLAKCPGDIMKLAKTIALEHHERWDGSGYLGMKGTEIQYISRLMAVCDVFDALTSKRYYKEGWSLEDAYNEIVNSSGKHFDPDVVQLFIDNFEEFKTVFYSMPDKEIY